MSFARKIQRRAQLAADRAAGITRYRSALDALLLDPNLRAVTQDVIKAAARGELPIQQAVDDASDDEQAQTSEARNAG